jgi:hypothetical protein
MWYRDHVVQGYRSYIPKYRSCATAGPLFVRQLRATMTLELSSLGCVFFSAPICTELVPGFLRRFFYRGSPVDFLFTAQRLSPRWKSLPKAPKAGYIYATALSSPRGSTIRSITSFLHRLIDFDS